MTTYQNSSQVPLAGRYAIVTGGGSGIGRAIAITLAEAGATVAVIDLTAEMAQQTVDAIAMNGGSARALGADITKEDVVNELVTDLAAAWGQIDILCNNAGIADPMCAPAAMTTAMWNRVIDVNLTGQFFVTRAVLPYMIAKRSGAIINTASPAGLRGAAGGLAYTSSKHAMVGFTKHIAWFYASDGIRCNAVCPGATATGIDGGKGIGAFDADGVARLMPVISAAGPPVDPQTTASVVLFLATDAATHVNGVILPVDGGWMAG